MTEKGTNLTIQSYDQDHIPLPTLLKESDTTANAIFSPGFPRDKPCYRLRDGIRGSSTSMGALFTRKTYVTY